MQRHNTTRRSFLMMSAAAISSAMHDARAGEAAHTAPTPQADEARGGIRVRFLGSGASGWNPEWAKTNPHMRRQSSVLLDGRALIDFTSCSFDMLPKDCRPEVLFQTHSHGDHYDPAAAVASGVRRIYVHETWAAAARRDIAQAARKLSLPEPEVVGLPFGKPVEECGLRFTGVPANHSTSRVTDGVLERTSLYLVEKGATRLLYATDTGGIPGDAARMIGIDPHIRDDNFKSRGKQSAPFVHAPQAITALIMEATNGDLDEDFRLFVHSSVQTVSRTINMLSANGRYRPPAGQPAYLTHLGLKYRDWPAAKVDANLPAPLRAAYDGLELTMG